jgi:Maltose acetyltransferase.
MTQYERMVKGLLYDPGDPEIMNEQSVPGSARSV